MTKSECPPEEIQRIAALCTTRWHRDYTRIKLRTDPAYAAVLREVSGTSLPLLDIGCGIGLLAMYLRGAGFDADVTGFDYDTGKIEAAKRMASSACRFQELTSTTTMGGSRRVRSRGPEYAIWRSTQS